MSHMWEHTAYVRMWGENIKAEIRDQSCSNFESILHFSPSAPCTVWTVVVCGNLQRDDSVMLFEGSPFQGATAIVQKLMSLSFQKVEHAITTIDSVLTIDSGLLIMVVGQLKTDNDPIHTFSETFYLKQFGDSLFVMNSVFRLSLHHQAWGG